MVAARAGTLPPPGLERIFLRRLPEILGAVTVPAAVCGLTAPDGLTPILATAFIASAWFLLVPLVLTCVTVTVMKGPVRRADPDRTIPD